MPGEKRSNALWGRGGRGFIAAAVAAAALAFPLPASADDDWNNGSGTVVAEAVVEQVENADSGERISVIVQSRTSTSTSAEGAVSSTNSAWDGPGTLEAVVADRYEFVDAVNVELPADEVIALATKPNLIITPDAKMVVAEEGLSFSNSQAWPHAAGNAPMWAGDAAYFTDSTPTIAIVDSGIEADRPDFAGRVIADLKIGDTNPGDTRGHGTFVASIAAGAADGYAGAAPTARILSLDVMDAQGAAFTSDVIRACERILELKSTHNIRVANFSLHSSWPASVRWDPLAQAVQKLWFNGVVVVSAAGNYGSAEGASGVPFAPANDPFSIAVAAGDMTNPSMGPGIDGAPQVHSVAWWSAYGYTLDGFSKPDLAAPGRYMVAAVPADSTLVAERPDNVVAPGYMQLSGTSFAAPVVAGTVAQMLARNPNLTPDEVKGALMLTAQPVWGAGPGAAGVGQINASAAADVQSPPNPNAALNQFLVQEATGDVVFNAEAWGLAVQLDAAWSSAAWSDAAWASAAWSSAAWADAAWASGSFEDAAWSDAAWSDAAWSDAAWSDGADDDPKLDLPHGPGGGGEGGGGDGGGDGGGGDGSGGDGSGGDGGGDGGDGGGEGGGGDGGGGEGGGDGGEDGGDGGEGGGDAGGEGGDGE